MAKQQEYEVCNQCEKELQLKVSFCPFCGAVQSVQASTLQKMPEETLKISKDIVSDKPTLQITEIQSKSPENEIPVSVLVKHITKKGNELVGIVVVGTSLELMRTYDRYAFKKDDGIFIRLKYLTNIPNEYLSAEQCQLKLQNDLVGLDPELDEAFEQPQPEVPVVKSSPKPYLNNQSTPLDSPQQKTSSFKYIAIVFIILLVVMFFMFSGNDNPDEMVSVDEEMQVDPCENANLNINNLLSDKMPTHALSIIKLNQAECKTNANFVQLVVSAEAQATSAKDKLTLAKEYLQAGNLELAHRTLLAALELDKELVGGVELLPQIESMIDEINNQEAQEEVPLDSETEQDDVQNISQQSTNHEIGQAQHLAQVERERIAAQRQAEKLQRERLKAEEAARRQNETRFDSQLSRAERALNTNNYGLAKSLAREVLSAAPGNSQAKRILHQAEAGEKAAFDNMVIE